MKIKLTKLNKILILFTLAMGMVANLQAATSSNVGHTHHHSHHSHHNQHHRRYPRHHGAYCRHDGCHRQRPLYAKGSAH